jgi:hypothetical protein
MPEEKTPRVIHTASEAIHALGGANFVAELFGIGANAVRNWYKRGLPPESHHKLASRLRAAGHDFNDEELFRQYPVASAPKPAKRPRKNGRKT